MNRYKRELQYLGLLWCILCAFGATVGAIVGWVTWNGRPAP